MNTYRCSYLGHHCDFWTWYIYLYKCMMKDISKHMASPLSSLPLCHSVQVGQYRGGVTEDCSDSSDYVFDIAINDRNASMAVSLSTNVIRLYSPSTGQFVGDCKGHSDRISQLAYAERVAPNLLCSSSTDGTLRAWDVRTRSQVGILRPNSDTTDVWSFSSGGSTGNLFVAGVGAQLIFWDWRTKQQVSCLEELHSEAVTQVQFFPEEQEKVASASVDGLICTVDVNGSMREDEGLESVINVGTSVSRFGFFGECHEKLWCLTHIETLSIWHLDSAVIEADFGDIRNKLTSKWPLSTVQYLVDCYYSSSLERLWVLGGTRNGSVGFFPVTCTPRGGTHITAATTILDGGHDDVVRTVCTPKASLVGTSGSSGLVHWSGGEDGRVCGWAGPRDYAPAVPPTKKNLS